MNILILQWSIEHKFLKIEIDFTLSFYTLTRGSLSIPSTSRFVPFAVALMDLASSTISGFDDVFPSDACFYKNNLYLLEW